MRDYFFNLRKVGQIEKVLPEIQFLKRHCMHAKTVADKHQKVLTMTCSMVLDFFVLNWQLQNQ